jgi:hypothetical protein
MADWRLPVTKMFSHGSTALLVVGSLLQANLTLAALQSPEPLEISPSPQASQTQLSQTLGSLDASAVPAASLQARSTGLNARSPLGMNLTGVVDWSTEWPFVDVFKQARPWISQREGKGWGEGGPLALTPDGWVQRLEPGQTADTVLINDRRYLPSGNYTLLYEGEGDLDFAFGNAKILSRSAGRMVVQVPEAKDGAVILQLKRTNPANPLRQLRFIMPGFENTYQSQPFHPVFLARLEKFKALRFMDWGETNNSEVQRWGDRTTRTQGPGTKNRGVPLEDMIALANALNIDPWFNVPHLADEDYVRSMAQMVKSQLKPQLQPRVEYSNEVWNYMFKQTQYALSQGKAQKLAPDDHSSMLRYYAQRSQALFKLWDGVYGLNSTQRFASGKRPYLRVISTQAVSAWSSEQVLGWNNTHQLTDELAVAPYFNGGWLSEADQAAKISKLTPDQVLDQLQTDIRGPVRKAITEQAQLASRYGLALSAYEGGGHLTAYQMPEPHQATIHKLFTEVNRNPRMNQLYTEYLNQWRDVLRAEKTRPGVFTNFSSTGLPMKWGYWGVLEYQNQPITAAPKYRALIEFIQANPLQP